MANCPGKLEIIYYFFLLDKAPIVWYTKYRN
jgi:hypothetical protein